MSAPEPAEPPPKKPTTRQIGGLEGARFSAEVEYRILEEIGRGGMGVAYLAERNVGGVKEHIVLKTIRDLDARLERQLAHEATLASRLRHQNIVRTHGLVPLPLDVLPSGVARLLREQLGDVDRVLCIAMDYVDGVDLLDLHLAHIQKGLLLPVTLGAYIVSRVARALEVAHRQLIHRDISAENVLIDHQGVPMLSDFGTAVAAGARDTKRVGKVSYMAPELIRKEAIDDTADIYSLGMLAYLVASGLFVQAAPQEGALAERFELVTRRIERGYPPLHELCPDVPETYSELVARMIARDRSLRPAKAGAVADEIEQNVLYASGFGPTYGSLGAYIDAFQSDFTRLDSKQQTQLSFLRDPDGFLRLRRPVAAETTYSELGRKWVARHDDAAELQASLESAPPEQPLSAGRPLLKVRIADNVSETVELQPGEALDIGRTSDCQVVLVDKLCSRRHARVEAAGDQILVTDLGSGNGTFLDGARLAEGEPRTLAAGSQLRIGNTALLFVHEPPLELPTETHDKLADIGPPASLLEKREFGLRLFARNRAVLRAFFDELGRRVGLPEDRAGALAGAVIEACALVSEDERSLLIAAVRSRTALRLTYFAPEGSRFLNKTLVMLKAILLGQDVELGSRKAGVQIVRHAFERIDFYTGDGALVLTKQF